MEAIAKSVPRDIADQIKAQLLNTGKQKPMLRYSGRRPYGLRKGETGNPELSVSHSNNSNMLLGSNGMHMPPPMSPFAAANATVTSNSMFDTEMSDNTSTRAFTTTP